VGGGGVPLMMSYIFGCVIVVCQINLLYNRIWKLEVPALAYLLLLHRHSSYSPVVSLIKHCGKSCGIGCNCALDWRNQGWSSSVLPATWLSRFQLSVLTVANYETCLCIWRVVFYFCYTCIYFINSKYILVIIYIYLCVCARAPEIVFNFIIFFLYWL